MDRKKYWESYPTYFIKRTAESDNAGAAVQQESSVVAGDKPIVARDVMVKSLHLLAAGPGLRWLEIGVGIGRSLPHILGLQPARVIASDISRTMLEQCRERFAGNDRIEFLEAEAERLGLPDASIDVAVCFGTFDALFQRQALIEFARVLAPGGRILVSGKNADYLDDDELALRAEKGAAAKGHPNFFTDIEKMLALAQALGLDLSAQRYALRRGDLGEEKLLEERPPRFYEYVLVLAKTGAARSTVPEGEIASATSRTAARISP